MKKKVEILFLLALMAAPLILLSLWRSQPQPWTRERALTEVSPPSLSDDRNSSSLAEVLNQAIQYWQSPSAPPSVFFGRERVSRERMRGALLEMRDRLTKEGLGEKFFRYLRERFRFYRSAAKQVLFTGYYEASLKGSLSQDPRFPYPLYRRPDDLVEVDPKDFSASPLPREFPRLIRGRVTPEGRLLPYYSRGEIDRGALAGKGLELAWVEDPVELFFLHIQGSGVISLDGGGEVRIHVAAQNGLPYKPIGRLFKERGLLKPEEISLQSLRAYLKAHPEERDAIFAYNPSYIFFETVAQGPLGATGVCLTPYRSLAIDPSLFPLGVPVYLETEEPLFDSQGKCLGWRRFSRLFISLDTGGAIKGPGRADIFTGFGERAEAIAGVMKQKGRLFFLAPSPARE